MTAEALHLLGAGRQLTTTASPGHPKDALWISTKDLERATGWSLKTEGLCREAQCVPLAAMERERLVDGEALCASGLWEQLDRPVLHDEAHSTWMLGEGAADRTSQLESLEAPDFTLPDIEGKLHSLSVFRGKKVFLATWASW
jgi:hypothetical protein